MQLLDLSLCYDGQNPTGYQRMKANAANQTATYEILKLVSREVYKVYRAGHVRDNALF